MPPVKILFKGPILLKLALSMLISRISPVLVPQYANVSEESIVMQFIKRFTCPSWQSVTKNLCFIASKVHSFIALLWTVMNFWGFLFKNLTS